MVSLIRSDLLFILTQIRYAETHASGEDLALILPNVQVPWGLRTISGAFNNLVNFQDQFGAADNVFPRMLTPFLRTAEARPANFAFPGQPPGATPTSYVQTSGSVYDSQPRTISNLIVDQTANNPAAQAAAAANPGSAIVTSPGLDGQFGTGDDTSVYYIPNITTDAGLSPPFNSWMTFFGQFFDHGLDLVTKGGNGTIFIPLKTDDPLYDFGADGPGGSNLDDGFGLDGLQGTADDRPNFMAVTRATITSVLPGADGVLGTSDDIHNGVNTTSPFVDQNQTYSSHPSHQVFLRAYELGVDGKPYDTGKLITNRDLGVDQTFGTGDDVELGGMATWAVVKAQARDLLGINLTDADVGDLPLLVADEYGNFLRGPNGFPMVQMKGLDGLSNTTDDIFLEGNPAAPLDLTNAVRTGHAFLNDIAHSAAPGAGLVRDNNGVIGGPQAPGTYDGELLDAHFIAGDGRVNENIGLTAVHAIFHSEHNRLVDHIKGLLIQDAQDLLAGGATQADAISFLNEWLSTDVTEVPASAAGLGWDGQRLFQAAKFATEMQYQHLVFEEFARTIQPNVDAFLAPSGYDTTIDPSIVAEFAHTVYRFGHSMLTETVDRFDADFNVVSANPLDPNEQIGLIAAFLNPLEFVASGATPEQATGAIVRGLTRQAGNEIDEFVTEALRNNLVGLPLDLAAINIARGRDTGIPSLNEARRQFYAMTGDLQLKPYTSWVDFVGHIKHPLSLINFIAAYGTHAAITSATTLADKRAAATLLVMGDGDDSDGVLINATVYTDRLDFLNATGAYAGGSLGGLNDVDLWIGGLAEEQMPFGGLLGSTFNFVFETQLEALQNGDRFYYLARVAGLNFGTELEMNSFAKLIMANTDVVHLPGNVFATVAYTLEVDQSRQFTGIGLGGREDPTDGTFIDGTLITAEVIRDNPNTAGPDSNYLQYTGVEHVVLGGTAGDDIIVSSEGDDTIYGDAGNDRIEGGYGNDTLKGGDGDDIITDAGGSDKIDGGAGNDVIHGGPITGAVENLLFGGDGNDFIVTGEDFSVTLAGNGNDFIYGAKTDLGPTGNAGDDWIEWGTQDGAPGDNFAPLLTDDIIGHDIFIGGPGFDEMIGEGGDDIMVGSDAQDKMGGMSGFDWVTYKNDLYGVTADMELKGLIAAHGPGVGVFQPVAPSPASLFDRFEEVEGLSGSRFADVLYGDNLDLVGILAHGDLAASTLSNIALIAGLQAVLDQAFGVGTASFVGGNLMLGGDGSDIITGRGGDDLIDGDKWLNVRISVHENADGSGAEIDSYDSMGGFSTTNLADPTTLMQKMFAGIYNPGQLVATREVLNGVAAGGQRYDTAGFRGNVLEYSIELIAGDGTETREDDVWRVTDTIALRDGVDVVMNIERLLFNDGYHTLYLDNAGNNNATGVLEILDNGTLAADATPTDGQMLRASLGSVVDADFAGGAINSAVTYTWQAETEPGTGIFEDFIAIAGDAFQSTNGVTFRVTTDLVGLSLRLKATFTDPNGVTEVAFSAPTAPVAPPAAPPAPPAPPVPDPVVVDTGPGVFLSKSDLSFILAQIGIAEQNAAGESLLNLLPHVRSADGLRTVSGVNNNLLHPEFGAADTLFPRLTDPVYNSADPVPPGFGPPGTTSYAQTSGAVFDSQPRTISNLVVDQTANNPAAYASAYDVGLNGVLDYNGALGDDVLKEGVSIVASPGLDGLFNTADDKDVFLFENVTPDAGLSAPFNAWMTFFGQFFDHGLDLVAKGGNGTVFVTLNPDDPLYIPGGPNFMAVTRATQFDGPGADGVLGTADDTHGETKNTTSPFVDQNQTYSSHPSHQVFLRSYELGVDGRPYDTGKLITNWNLGPDGRFTDDPNTIGVDEGANNTEIGGMATWAVVKAQARDLLGINLTDADVGNLPLLATDDYGNFIRGPNGFPMVVMKGLDGLAGTTDDILVEGDPLAPIDLTDAVRTGHAFLDDIAHTAAPKPGLVRFTDGDATNGATPVGTYDGDLLDAHYIAGDGRVNENIGLTTVHAIFHSEHNRLVDQVKNTVIATADLDFINEWLRTDVGTLPTAGDINSLDWDGQRLFQAAKFATEMQYQHLVFEEFARAVQPMIDIFFAPTQVYDVELNPSIVAEFAHTVYRFGHSMLTETVDRFDPNFNPVTVDPLHPTNDQQLGLIAAFLNPLAYAASGATPEEAAGAIARGVTRTVGNEIDEFVTEALRNNLVGLPLDLAAINIARGRDTGIPSLNEARREFYGATQDSNLKPYTSWADLVQHLRHPESVINFIAAYGTHAALTAADVDTMAEMRAVATALVLGGSATINAGTLEERVFTADNADRLDFLNSQGIYANLANGVTTTGVDDIDLWIGGLAEKQTPFGGLLGSTFNFVFENQMEKLQDADRFYYLERTAGLNFVAELEGNSFARMIMANTDATHLPALVFTTPAYTLEVDQSRQFTGLGATGRDDPTNGTLLTPEVIRDNPDTLGPDSNYLRYTGVEHIVLGGTNPGAFVSNLSGNDILISSEGDDTVYGDGGDDYIDGGYGNDQLRGGAGDDIIRDLGGDDNIQGGDGNDVIHGGNGVNLIIAGAGQDFIVTGEDANESFGGQGNDFILGTPGDEQNMGGEGHDWIEGGTTDGSPGDNFDPAGLDPIVGNDVYIGRGENDKFNAEGGDDIMVGSVGFGDRYIGASGFDWATFMNDPFGVTIDALPGNRFFDQPVTPGSGASVLTRYDFVEGYAGSNFGDVIRGDSFITLAGNGATGSVLTNIALIDGLQELLNALDPDGPAVTSFDSGNIIIGGGGGDFLEGRGGNDRLDGDAWLDVYISVRATVDLNNDNIADRDANGNLILGAEIDTFDSMIGRSTTNLSDVETLLEKMLSRDYNPGQLQIAREIKYAPVSGFDTAVFSGNADEYTIVVDDRGTASRNDDIITVTDNNVAPRDGVDTLTHIERLQFADGYVRLYGANEDPDGLVAVNLGDPLSAAPRSGVTLTASALGVLDGDNITSGGPITGPIAYFWQAEILPGVFEDITVTAAGELARVAGPTFTPTDAEVGLALRVRAVYRDENGTLEEVYSAPTAPVAAPAVNTPAAGAPVLSDITPTEGIALTADTASITDGNGLAAPVFAFQWQQSNDGGLTWLDIAGATSASFTPTQDQVLSLLRVRVQFVDDAAFIETLFSDPTGNVGDMVVGDANPNTLLGTDFSDWLIGLGGADTLDGGLGADLMEGGLGDDTYFVDDLADIVTEAINEGVDTIITTLNDQLIPDNVENMTFAGVGDFFVLGNALNNVIIAGAGSDLIEGAEGDDTLFGNAGLDTLDGGLGNDILDGGADADTLAGGDGDDTYVINDLDAITELAGGGVDTVQSSLTYTLGDELENLTLTGADPINGTGNGLANTITGNDAANTLDGGAGVDTLVGAGGNDTYVINDADLVVEALGGGTDLVLSSISFALTDEVENLTLVGADPIDGTGNALANVITGNNSVNTLDGGLGGDTLFGAGGDDALLGGDDDDTLSGDAGDDLIDGGAGSGDVAMFSGNFADYVFSAHSLGGLRLVDTRGIDSTAVGDRVINAEFLQFADVTIPYVNAAPTGAPTIAGAIFREGETLTADAAAIADANGLASAVFTFTWQMSTDGGLTWADVGTGVSFTPAQAQVNAIVRVNASYFDDFGFAETVSSAATPVIADVINDGAAGNLLTGTIGDDIINGNGGADTINALAGADLINGGADADIIDAGEGDDIITYLAGQGADVVDGGAGADTLNIVGGAGAQVLAAIYGGAVLTAIGGGAISNIEVVTIDLDGGVDTLSYVGSAAAVTVNLAAASASGFASLAGVENVTGGSGADLLVGSAGANVLAGDLGDDTLVGGAGIDTLNGGAGVDTADYSAETDNLFITIPGNMRRGSAAAAIEDTLFAIENVIGGSGADSITGSGGSNVLTGGLGGDTLLGAGGDDTVDGGEGDDTLRGGIGADAIIGGEGNDTIIYIMGEGADTMDGGGGIDTLGPLGTAANDTLDVVYDGAALTALEGGTLVNIEAVNAAMGGGVDTLSYVGSLAAVTVNLNTGAASGFASTSSIENVTGGAGDDALTGNALNNVLSGGEGADTLVGGAGVDTLNGGGGADTISGGIGADAIDAGAGADTVLYQFGDGVDSLVDGGADSDTFVITANAGANTLNVVFNGSVITNAAGVALTNIESVSADLLGGVDTLSFTSTAGAVSANLAAGTASGFGTIAGIENLIGGQGGDTLTGDGGANVINGGAGAGADTLDGAGGGDTLLGGAGADTMIGGAGNDVMNGGNDNDTFVFSAGFGNDTIAGFDANVGGGQDMLDISALGITAADFAARVVITDLGNDTLLTIDGVDTITLTGVNGNGANVITQADFILGGP